MFKKLLQVKASSNYTKKTRQKQLFQHNKIILIDTWKKNTRLSNLYGSWGPENTQEKPPSNPRSNQQHTSFWKPVPTPRWWEAVWRNIYPCTSMCRHALCVYLKKTKLHSTHPKKSNQNKNRQTLKKTQTTKKQRKNTIKHTYKPPDQPGIKINLFCFQE